MSQVIKTVDTASNWLIANMGTGKKIRVRRNLSSIHYVVYWLISV